MSAYTDSISRHAIYERLALVDATIQDVKALEDKPQDDVEALARIALVVKNFSAALESCDKNLISVGWLSDADKALVNINNYLAAYKTSKTAAQLNPNAFNQLPVLLQCSVNLNCVRSRQTLKGITDALQEYTNIIEEHGLSMAKYVHEMKADVDGLKEAVRAQQKLSSDSLADLKGQIDSEKKRLDSLVTQYQNQMVEDKKAVLAQVEEFKAMYGTERDIRKKEIDGEIDVLTQRFNQSSKEIEKQEEDFRNNSEVLIQDYKTKFNQYEQQVKDIVGIITTNVFSHKYREVANNARARSAIWHLVTVGFMIAVSWFAIQSFVVTANTELSWVGLIAKIFTTTTFAAGAAYAARQASKQEKVERYARKIEMELVTIDPFIESLTDEQQSELKVELTRKLFGNPDAMEMSSKDEGNPEIERLASIEGVTRSILEIVSKVKP